MTTPYIFERARLRYKEHNGIALCWSEICNDKEKPNPKQKDRPKFFVDLIRFANCFIEGVEHVQSVGAISHEYTANIVQMPQDCAQWIEEARKMMNGNDPPPKFEVRRTKANSRDEVDLEELSSIMEDYKAKLSDALGKLEDRGLSTKVKDKVEDVKIRCDPL